jgi:hypothetical protein
MHLLATGLARSGFVIIGLIGVPALVFVAALRGISWPSVVAPIAAAGFFVALFFLEPASYAHNDTRGLPLAFAICFAAGYALIGVSGLALRMLWLGLTHRRRPPESN